ncbi:MAG: hypothetical protein ACJARG_001106 [Arcticibacterium sp.]|jgi:hypothetical protein
MKWNMGSTDRAIRLAIAVVSAILIYNNVITGIMVSASILVTAVLFITSAVGFCPIYFPFRISTKKN